MTEPLTQAEWLSKFEERSFARTFLSLNDHGMEEDQLEDLRRDFPDPNEAVTWLVQKFDLDDIEKDPWMVAFPLYD